MIRVQIKGEALDLKQGQEIEFLQDFNIFNFEAVEGTKALSFNLPYTNKNRRLLAFADRPASRTINAQYDCLIEVAGILLYEGVLKVNTGQERNDYRAYFLANAGVLAEFKDVLISEIVNEVITFSGVDYSNLNEYLSVNSDIVFPTIHSDTDLFLSASRNYVRRRGGRFDRSRAVPRGGSLATDLRRGKNVDTRIRKFWTLYNEPPHGS